MGAIFVLSFCFAPEKELVLSPGSLIFAAAAQGSPLDCLALVASGTYDRVSHRTVTSGKMAHKELLP